MTPGRVILLALRLQFGEGEDEIWFKIEIRKNTYGRLFYASRGR